MEAAPHLPTSASENRRLVDCIRAALSGTGYGRLRQIEVSVRGGTVFLSGRVPSYHLKQVAQTVAQSVPGIERVRNDLEVVVK